MLREVPILKTHDVNKDIILRWSAFPHGIVWILSHNLNGQEMPVSYASSALNKYKRNDA